MSDGTEGTGMRARSEGAIGELAQALLENPILSQALGGALGVGERAIQVQRGAMSALDVPSAESIDQLGRRIRALGDRLESIEDTLDAMRSDLSAVRAKLEAEAKGTDPATI